MNAPLSAMVAALADALDAHAGLRWQFRWLVILEQSLDFGREVGRAWDLVPQSCLGRALCELRELAALTKAPGLEPLLAELQRRAFNVELQAALRPNVAARPATEIAGHEGS